MNRFKGLDLANSVSEELWTEVCIGGSEQNHPKEKEKQEGKVVISGGFTNSRLKKRSEKQRREGKYIQLNAECQKTARRDMKAFFKEQCL